MESIGDIVAGMYLAQGVLAALYQREKTGEGQYVDTALYECAFSFMDAHIAAYEKLGYVVGREGAGHSGSVVNNLFKTRDGELAVTVRDVSDAAAVERAIGAGIDGLAAWCAERGASDAMEALQRAGVPAGRVQNAHHMFTDDPQLAARGFFRSFASPVFGERPFERSPALFGDLKALLGPACLAV